MAAFRVKNISCCFSSLRQSFLQNNRIDLNDLPRLVLILSRCNLSIAARKVKSSEDAVESHPKKTKLPILSDFENRNPRNPEYFGYNKPRGYATQKYRKDYYNKLKFIISNRHSRAEVLHNSGVVLVSASTAEFEITRHLYKTTDISAAKNLGRVLAQRCQEAGITRVYWEPQYGDRNKLRVKAFSSALAKGGFVKLNEHRRVIHPQTFYCDYTPKNRRRKWIRLPSSKRKKEHITRTK
ncbi:unnamed protein product [Porites evermanni]|uniref:Ribosomal protein L18 n=1 Tax=Porites evermanni TaxID=104178 RepID=A0ABN8SMF7_9CNID|nr:unnamed protein product [Porites evermanni]